MAYRPTWQGHLKLSLVTCPVALYTATNPGGDVHFHLINPKTNNRIKMITTDPETGPVERQSLVKGYEVSKGEYILLTEEEIKAVKLESTKTIDIERFVPGDEISDAHSDPAMISIAEKIIEQQEGPFDPSQFVDRYEEALKALIEEKTKGHKSAHVAEPDDTNVIDLISALRASLAAKGKVGGDGGKAAPAPAAKSTKAANKKSASQPKSKVRKAS